jgi:hypothetical protein
VLTRDDALRFLGLFPASASASASASDSSLLPQVAMLAGNDATAHLPQRALLLRSVGLDGAHIRDIAHLFAQHHDPQRLQWLLRAFLLAPEHQAFARVWEATEVRACLPACVHACMYACVRACMFACVRQGKDDCWLLLVGCLACLHAFES